MPSLTTLLDSEVQEALRRLLDDPSGPLVAQLPGQEAPAIRRAARSVSDSMAPLIEHATNTEPWYQSRVTWGAILSGLTPLLALGGWTLTPQYRDELVSAIVAAAPLIGAAVTLYGRWRATRPIGAAP